MNLASPESIPPPSASRESRNSHKFKASLHWRFSTASPPDSLHSNSADSYEDLQNVLDLAQTTYQENTEQQNVADVHLSDSVSLAEEEAAASSVDWLGGRNLSTGTLSSHHEPLSNNEHNHADLHVTCDDTVLEFSMETELRRGHEPDEKWPQEHHLFEYVAVFNWTLVSLASVARRHAAGRWVDSPPLQAPEQPSTRWAVRLFPSGLPDNERSHMVTSFGCLSLDPILGDAAIARITLQADIEGGTTGCEYVTLMRPGVYHCTDSLLPRYGAPRDLHLKIRVAWSSFILPLLLAAPPPVHGLVTRFDTGKVLRRRRHDSYQVRVRASWRIEEFFEWYPPRGTQHVSPFFGCDAVVWSLQVWPNGGRAADPEGFLRAVVHLMHLPANLRAEGIRVNLRVNNGDFRNTLSSIQEDGTWGCLAGPRHLIPLSAGGAFKFCVELWYDSPSSD